MTYTVTAADGKTKANFVVTVNVATTVWKMVAKNKFISMQKPSAFAHDGKLWLVGSTESGGKPFLEAKNYNEYVYSSTDGITWNKIHESTKGKKDSIPVGINAYTTTFNKKMFKIGGQGPERKSGKPWPPIERLLLGASSSSDGKAWTHKSLKDAGLPETGMVNPQVAVKNGKMYILGYQSIVFGQVGAISAFSTYESSDGTSFTKLGDEVLKTIKSTPLPPTIYATGVFKDELYVAGGISGAFFLSGTVANYSKSVYKSKDGKTWTVATKDGFPALAGSQIIEYKGKLYAIAGATAKEGEKKAIYTRDVYVSADGVKWDKVTGGLALPDTFKPRAFHKVVVLNNKIS